jgi:hypothetical protein
MDSTVCADIETVTVPVIATVIVTVTVTVTATVLEDAMAMVVAIVTVMKLALILGTGPYSWHFLLPVSMTWSMTVKLQKYSEFSSITVKTRVLVTFNLLRPLVCCFRSNNLL